jgi:hypothetical protein
MSKTAIVLLQTGKEITKDAREFFSFKQDNFPKDGMSNSNG